MRSCLFFFFSSRRRHTRCYRDWSSDVCSSDLAAIAPSIGPCCYEVDEPVTRELARAYPGRWKAWATPGRPGRVMLDLWSANEALLRGAGVDPARVENPRLCTACHPELLYSYRRGSRGRLVTLAALP